MSTGYYMDDIAIEYREEIEVLKQKDEAHTGARQRMASEIESLIAERNRLANALRPFAAEADRYDPEESEGENAEEAYASQIWIGDLRAARAALKVA